MDIDSLGNASLEAVLVSGRTIGAPDEHGLVSWLARVGMTPGRSCSVPTTDAFVLYRDYCRHVGGCEPLEPFEFAREMLAKFSKGLGALSHPPARAQCYLTNPRAAKKLRAMRRALPPTEADKALFSFNALRIARHPARRLTVAPRLPEK